MSKNEAAHHARLEMIARGDLTPAEALSVIRDTLDHTERGAVRDFVWRTLTARDFGDDLSEWHDVVRHSVSLTRKKGSEDFAERLYALAELISQSGRFAELQPVGEVLQRKHVRQLLVIVGSSPRAVPRSELAEKLNLGDANLSRILTLLASIGLITRRRIGKEASFELTEAGRAAVAGEIGVKKQSTANVNIEAVGVPMAVWNSGGWPAGANSDFLELIDTLGGASTLTASQSDCEALFSNRALEKHSLEGCDLLRFADDRWLQCRYRKSSEFSGRRFTSAGETAC